MNGNIVKFLKQVEQDEALVAKLNAIKDPDEAYALAASVQDGFTKEEFVAAMEGIRNGELSDADLAKMSGGIEDDVLMSASISASVSSSVTSLSAAAGAAAAI